MPPTATAGKTKQATSKVTEAADPLVPYCMWKLRQSTLNGLKAEAEERGATVAGLVRKVLGDWVKARQRGGKGKSRKAA